VWSKDIQEIGAYLRQTQWNRLPDTATVAAVATAVIT